MVADAAIDLPTILDRLAATSRRPRYALMVLNLLSEAADHKGQAGPFVKRGDDLLPIRLWVGETLARMAARHPRRQAMRARIEEALRQENEEATLPLFAQPASDSEIEREVAERARISGGTNVSRAVSDLVRCGLVKRHYAGYRSGHHAKGGQRHAVYVLEADTLAALRRGTQLL